MNVHILEKTRKITVSISQSPKTNKKKMIKNLLIECKVFIKFKKLTNKNKVNKKHKNH
jgi:hypothetical protein